MSRFPDGHENGSRFRRFRTDRLGSRTVGSFALPPGKENGHSGRRLVVVACGTILVLWGALYLVFRDWRARYRERARFGATQVAPVVDSLSEINPEGVDAQAWQQAVRETHEMLVSVTAANLLDLKQMEALRDELKQIVQRARNHPETARDELARIWNAMADRAGFVLQEGTSGRKRGHPRPAILPPRPEKSKSPSLDQNPSSRTKPVPAS